MPANCFQAERRARRSQRRRSIETTPSRPRRTDGLADRTVNSAVTALQCCWLLQLLRCDVPVYRLPADVTSDSEDESTGSYVSWNRSQNVAEISERCEQNRSREIIYLSLLVLQKSIDIRQIWMYCTLFQIATRLTLG